jgi:hypothetical protein
VNATLVDPLTNFFIQIPEDYGLLDVEPVKLIPTWRNKRVGDGRSAKRMNRFVLSKGF